MYLLDIECLVIVVLNGYHITEFSLRIVLDGHNVYDVYLALTVA